MAGLDGPLAYVGRFALFALIRPRLTCGPSPPFVAAWFSLSCLKSLSVVRDGAICMPVGAQSSAHNTAQTCPAVCMSPLGSLFALLCSSLLSRAVRDGAELLRERPEYPLLPLCRFTFHVKHGSFPVMIHIDVGGWQVQRSARRAWSRASRKSGYVMLQANKVRRPSHRWGLPRSVPQTPADVPDQPPCGLGRTPVRRP